MPAMVTSPRFTFFATLVVAVAAVVLTLVVTVDSDPPVRLASQLPPPQR